MMIDDVSQYTSRSLKSKPKKQKNKNKTKQNKLLILINKQKKLNYYKGGF